MDIKRYIREISASSYYRRRPLEALKYGYAKYIFRKWRVKSVEEMLIHLAMNPSEAFSGIEKWRSPLEQAVASDSDQHGIPLQGGLLLFGIVRSCKPEVVIETGIAAGVSTSFILAAMIENRMGKLYSIDLPPVQSSSFIHADGSDYSANRKGLGWVIPKAIREAARDRHSVILENVKTALPKLLDQVQKVQLFFHDDLHTPEHMLWEYETVWARLSSGGILASDDVNYGWIKFCKEKHVSNGLRNLMRIGAVRK